MTLGNQSSSIAQGALGVFIQSNYKWRPNLTLDLGLRYDWNMTPTERYSRFIVFDPQTASLVRLGRGGGNGIYHQNNKNFQPRLGFAWDPFKDGKTSVRGAYAVHRSAPHQRGCGHEWESAVGQPLTFAGTVSLANAIGVAQAAGLAPMTVDHAFRNAYLQSWNLNLQRELLRGLAVMAGYFGSKGTHLTLARNINQPIDGARPYPAVSPSSRILPGMVLSNIIQMESTGIRPTTLCGYRPQPLARGLQFSCPTPGRSRWITTRSARRASCRTATTCGETRSSDYDARQRIAVSAIYGVSSRARVGNSLRLCRRRAATRSTSSPQSILPA